MPAIHSGHVQIQYDQRRERSRRHIFEVLQGFMAINSRNHLGLDTIRLEGFFQDELIIRIIICIQYPVGGVAHKFGFWWWGLNKYNIFLINVNSQLSKKRCSPVKIYKWI